MTEGVIGKDWEEAAKALSHRGRVGSDRGAARKIRLGCEGVDLDLDLGGVALGKILRAEAKGGDWKCSRLEV
jgi:hypothetical protein